MNSVAKALIPGKEWLIKHHDRKVGSITKIKKGYALHSKGRMLSFKNLNEIQERVGITVWEEPGRKKKEENTDGEHRIYDYPCRTKPYDPIYNLKLRLPIYAKSSKSKSQYCAGYYLILRRKGWATSFCPKLITIERYAHHGPFKTEADMKSMLNTITKNENT